MAKVLRSTDGDVQVLADAVNDLKAQIGAGSHAHLDACERVITAANASDLASSIALVNQIMAVYVFHAADLLSHMAAGNPLASTVRATDLASAIARANDIKAKHNAHCASTAQHFNADSTNTTAATDATTQNTLNTLLNEMKADINAHAADAPAAKSLRVVPA